MRNKLVAAIGILVFLFTACTDENPDLVNPPSQKEHIKMRFINFSSDYESRILNLDGENLFEASYAMASEAKNPPSDSVVAVIKKGDTEEFQFPKKIKFVRTTYTSCLSLPTPVGSAKGDKATDTLVYFSSSSSLPVGTAYSYIKFVNAFPDSTCSFSLVGGCPNGDAWFSSLAYRSVSSQLEVTAGSNPMSLIKENANGREVIGLYDVTLANDLQYAAIVSAGTDGEPVFSMLSEHEDSPDALARPQRIADNTASVRTLNFSSQTVSIHKSGETVASDVPTNKATGYETVSACTSQYADTLSASYSGFTSASNTLSIDVYGKYTFLVADSATKRAGMGIVIPEAKVTYLYNDRALIRVVNLIDGISQGIYLESGARTDSSADGYVSGETIASKVDFGEVSSVYPLYLGSTSRRIPLLVSGTATPTRVLLTSFAEMQPAKSYIIVLAGTVSEPKLYCIEEESEDFTLSAEPVGEMFQFVNFETGEDAVTVADSNTIENATIDYTRGFASVAELGDPSMRVGSATTSWSADKFSGTSLIVASGESSSPRFITLKSEIPDGRMAFSRRRFLNAASDVPSLAVRLDEEDGETTAGGVSYGAASEYLDDSAQRSYSLFFINESTGKLIYRLDDIQVVHGKIYTFILGGTASTGYSVKIVQEY